MGGIQPALLSFTVTKTCTMSLDDGSWQVVKASFHSSPLAPVHFCSIKKHSHTKEKSNTTKTESGLKGSRPNNEKTNS